MDDMRITDGASKAWDVAVEEAARSKYHQVEKEHLMIGLLSLEKKLGMSEVGNDARLAMRAENGAVENVLYGALEGHEVAVARLRRRIRLGLGEGIDEPEEVIHRSEACKRIFDRALELSPHKREVSCIHLLAAILEDPGPAIEQALAEEGIKVKDMIEPAMAWVTLAESGSDWSAMMEDDDKSDGIRSLLNSWLGKNGRNDTRPSIEVHESAAKTYLDTYGRDLTREALEGRLGPFAGRRQELLQLIRIFGRHTKNNPVLVGEAGVGKTAIVEALAMRTAHGKDPQMLGGYHIIELSMGTLLANTRYRGEFEERLTKIIEEAQARPDIILFIDEIHSIVGSGKSDGSSMDAASILKPALARGLRCIGATTLAEYQRHIEADPALERRFEKVVVREPGRDDAMLMLQALKPKLEEYHGVRIQESSLAAAIDLSIRFDADHQLPDKAIDLLDRACAGARIPSLSLSGYGNEKREVDEKAIAVALSDKTGIPLEIIASSRSMPKSRLLELEPYLKKKLVGQDDAIGRVCQRLQIAYAGLGKRSGPIAVLLFAGPSGVGKTELARSLTEFLFGSANEMIRFDMSEYMEEHSIAKLIGSPPGYVGHDEEGQLSGRLRSKPYAVVLFDEVEKAHPKVLDLFLQLFDEGRITDSKGRTADASNAIFIMTSNLKPQGFNYGDVEAGALKKAMRGQLKKPDTSDSVVPFRPELLNRVDDLIMFRSLDETRCARDPETYDGRRAHGSRTPAGNRIIVLKRGGIISRAYGLQPRVRCPRAQADCRDIHKSPAEQAHPDGRTNEIQAVAGHIRKRPDQDRAYVKLHCVSSIFIITPPAAGYWLRWRS